MTGIKNRMTLLLFGIGSCATMHYNGMNDPYSKMIAMICFGLLFMAAIFCWRSIPSKTKVFGSWLKWFLLACLINLFYGIDPTNQDIALPLMVAFSSYCLLDIPREKFVLYLLPVCIFSTYCAVRSVLCGLGSFSLSSFDDNEIVKNQIGAAFTTVAIVCAVAAMDKHSRWFSIIYALLSIVNVYPAVFFSCRTALLCYGIVVFYVLFASLKYKALLVIPLIIILFVYFGGTELQSILYESIVGKRDASNMDDLTSGRLTHATIAYHYFIKHPLLGYYGSGDPSLTARAHIYLLRRLCEWGIVGAIPFFALYFSIFRLFVKSVKSRIILLAAPLMLSMIESFSEYAPPFGPGSSFIVMFIIIGYYLRIEPSLSK